jgi:hypothetical protein
LAETRPLHPNFQRVQVGEVHPAISPYRTIAFTIHICPGCLHSATNSRGDATTTVTTRARGAARGWGKGRWPIGLWLRPRRQHDTEGSPRRIPQKVVSPFLASMTLSVMI